MDTTKHEVNQKICDTITQLQIDVESTLEKIFAQAGSKLQLHGQEEVKKGIEDTKQLLESLKSSYV